MHFIEQDERQAQSSWSSCTFLKMITINIREKLTEMKAAS